jgi:hypothetical protein
MSWKSVFSFLLVSFALPSIGKAEVNRSWESLAQSVKVGKQVVVIRMNAGQMEGRLLSINAESITVEERGNPQVIRRDDVFRVRYANIRRRHTLLGLAIGAGAGAAIGAAAEEGEFRGAAATIMGLAGLGVGAAVGGALPIGPPLYEAEAVRRGQ